MLDFTLDEKASIKLSNKRCEEIKTIIAKMYQKYCITTIPINCFELAIKMGIKVIPYSAYNQSTIDLLLSESEDGFFVEKTDGSLYIFYNDSKSYGRIRHTIMHEIAHIILGHTEDSELAEKEVKFFAKYALAPPPLIHRYRNMIKSVPDVCVLFDISYEACGYALDYYNKWLRFGKEDYTDYELQITKQVTKLCI